MALNWQDYIHADQTVLSGKPVVKDTRLSVEFLLERLADGWTEKDLLDNYPRLTKEALQAVRQRLWPVNFQVWLSATGSNLFSFI